MEQPVDYWIAMYSPEGSKQRLSARGRPTDDERGLSSSASLWIAGRSAWHGRARDVAYRTTACAQHTCKHYECDKWPVARVHRGTFVRMGSWLPSTRLPARSMFSFPRRWPIFLSWKLRFLLAPCRPAALDCFKSSARLRGSNAVPDSNIALHGLGRER